MQVKVTNIKDYYASSLRRNNSIHLNTINVSGLSNGIYIVNTEGDISQRLIIEK